MLQKIDVMDYLSLAMGALLGGLATLLIMLLQKRNKQQSANTQNAVLQSTINRLEEDIILLRENLQAEESERRVAEQNTATLKADNQHLQEQLEKQTAQLTTLQDQFAKDFQLVAQKILDQNSEKFTEQNRLQIDRILQPLREKIDSFEKKVDDTNKEHLSRHSALTEQIKSLKEMSEQLGQEALNLTQALKGDTKKQGNWGEIMLERILESSGLRKDEEYQLQVNSTHDDGRRVQPDAVVLLPDDKHIIIDAKVSLVHYEKCVNAASREEQERFQALHIQSVKSHIKGLSEKQYPQANGFQSPDFVLLFLPIEASLGVALSGDQDLFTYAWDRKIVLVTPSTLLATLRTIAAIWKQERQNRNALEIAEESGKLYDKLVGFLEDMDKIRKGIDTSREAYDKAFNKLRSGRGNLIGKAEKIKALGANASKQIPNHLSGHED